jgi:hypothetical protein
MQIRPWSRDSGLIVPISESSRVQVSGPNGTDIEVSPGATYFGLVRLIDCVGVTRKVHRALQQTFMN